MTIKTAISINEALFKQVNNLAAQLKVSRSCLFVMAVEEFIKRHENQMLLQQLNQVYDKPALSGDEQTLSGIRRHHRDVLEGEW
jgi:metal-responsive CopG/Arc/MetJ family transcriptional regulator